MRGTQLSQLIDMLRAETGHSQHRAAGINTIDNLKLVIHRTQDMLYNMHDWSFLQVHLDVNMVVNQGEYDFPPGLNFTRIQNAWHNLHTDAVLMEYGITPLDYRVNSGSAKDLIKWQHTGSDKFEVWPKPASAQQTVTFYGIRNLAPLIDESDTAELDDNLIVLFGAAEMLARQGADDAEAKQALAERLYARLTSMSGSQKRIPIRLSGGSIQEPQRPGIDYVLRYP